MKAGFEDVGPNNSISVAAQPLEPVGYIDEARWQPKWLRQRVLGAFFVVYLGLIAIIATMTLYSRYHDGLFEVRDREMYLWRFGPAAILTLLSILWGRVKLQTLRYTHWSALREDRDVGLEIFQLDYSEMVIFKVLVQSLRSGHYFVFVVAVISVILKAQTVLVAGLFLQSVVEVQYPIDITTSTSFMTDTNSSMNMAAYDTALSLRVYDMVYPFGISEDVAYQTFEKRGTLDSPIVAVVDGLFMNATCRQLEDWTLRSAEVEGESVEEDAPLRYSLNTTIDLHFENCDEPVTGWIETNIESEETQRSGDPDEKTWWTFKKMVEPSRPCSSLPQQNKQFLYFGAILRPSSQNETLDEIDSLGAVLCTSSYWMSNVRVEDNGTPNVTALQDREIIELSPDPWDILIDSIPSGLTQGGDTFMWDINGIINGPIAAASQFRGELLDSSDERAYESELMEQAVLNLTSDLGPSLSHYLMRQNQDGSSRVEGTRINQTRRLLVNEGIGLAMTLLFILPAVICLWATFRLTPLSKLWYRNPATLLGAAIFCGGAHFRQNSAHVLAGSRESGKMQWSHGSHSPLVLRPWARIAFCFYTTGIFVALICTLKLSQDRDGLVETDGPDDRYSILWTSLPALLLLAIAQYVSVSDFEIRGVATFLISSTRDCSIRELDMSLLDMLGFRAFWHSLWLRVPAVTLSQMLTAISAFLTALSAVLFSPKVVTETHPATFRQQTWFGSPEFPSDVAEYRRSRDRIGSMILSTRGSNLTYPNNTYENLVFPALHYPRMEWESGVSVTATVPAAKLVPDCTRVSEATDGPAYVIECPDGSQEEVPDYSESVPEEDGDGSYFLSTFLSPGNVVKDAYWCGEDIDNMDSDDVIAMNPPWRVQTYIWGKLNADEDFEYSAAWQCNYSWTEVMTETVLVPAKNGGPMIDHNTPPTQLDAQEARPWTPGFAVPDFDNAAINEHMATENPGFVFADRVTTDDRLASVNGIFKAIMQPTGPIALENFGDEDYEAQILEEIHFAVSLAAAQLANLENRLNLDQTSLTEPEEHADLATIDATIITRQRYRLMQNRPVTYVILAILAAVLLVNLWALFSTLLRHMLSLRRSHWLLDMEFKGLVPDGFSSIEMTSALLHGSNIGRNLPENAHLLSKRDLWRRMKGKRFRMGWFATGSEMEKVYTIGEVHDERFPFLAEKEAVKGEDYRPVRDPAGMESAPSWPLSLASPVSPSSKVADLR